MRLSTVEQWPDSLLIPPHTRVLVAKWEYIACASEEDSGGGEARAVGRGCGRAIRTQRAAHKEWPACGFPSAPVSASLSRVLSLTGPPGSFQLFHRCQRAVQALPSRARRTCSKQEERLLRNVVASLAQTLQELSSSFRHAQGCYLRRECDCSLAVCLSSLLATDSPLGPEPLTGPPLCDTSPMESRVVSCSSQLGRQNLLGVKLKELEIQPRPCENL